nr:MAG TPA: hypothetical protein [Caudoviricetes sp.]
MPSYVRQQLLAVRFLCQRGILESIVLPGNGTVNPEPDPCVFTSLPAWERKS